MEKIWLKNYPDGVAPTLDIDPNESLVDMFEDACAEYSDAPAFTNMGRTVTYRELDKMTARFAAWLQNNTNLSAGDRVAIMMPNLLQFPVALFGILRAGMVVVNVNPLYTARELEHQLIDSQARGIVIASTSCGPLDEIIGETAIDSVVVTDLGDLLNLPNRWIVNFVIRWVKRMVPNFNLPNAVSFRKVVGYSGEPLKRVTPTGADLAVLQYTGGTTGRAKGAMLSHGNLSANVSQINGWFGGLVRDKVEIMITAMPLYHVYALTCNCLCYLKVGAHNVLITDPRNTKAFINEMKKYPFTAITGVNTLYHSLVIHPDFPTVDCSHLKVVSAGGMAVLEDTAQKWMSITGKSIIQGYGLSETSPVLTSNRADVQGFKNSIGLPLPSTDLSLRDRDGNEVPLGEPGEIYARGPQVMSAYWNNPEETAGAMSADGYFKTGDIAVVDEEGYFRIVDREKDMIIVSGFNVYPNEIENVITLHPDVVEAACVGVKDKRGREVVKLFVVLRPGAPEDSAAIRRYCRENLAAYKVPKHIEFRDSLPKSNVGKILRRKLRDEEAD